MPLADDFTASSLDYPARIEGRPDEGLSRWMWLVKWFLAIPHLVIIAVLWIALWVLTVVAFFAILITARYPRSMFDFNVGVLRWTWRVFFYALNPVATDQYPPFTLKEVSYPAELHVPYPDELSRGLVLFKWWLLAIPHYIIVAMFTSGVFLSQPDQQNAVHIGGGLIGVLVLIALVGLLVMGRYWKGLFDFIMGLNRWAFRVFVYAALMRDEYPPFRLDLGGTEHRRGEEAASDENSHVAGEA
jgi:hypothetical protein